MLKGKTTFLLLFISIGYIDFNVIADKGVKS